MSSAPYENRKRRRLWIETLERRWVLAAINFVPQSPVDMGVERAGSIALADLDGDQDEDLIVAGTGGVQWHENIDSLGSFGPGMIADGTSRFFQADPIDMDLDGDLDVMAIASEGPVWIENDGSGQFLSRHRIGDSHATFVDLADLDRDGDLDLLARNRILTWHENLDGAGTFSEGRLIAEYVAAVKAADIDDDGDVDILYVGSASSVESRLLYWIENSGGVLGEPVLLDHSSFVGVSHIHAADPDRDGDLDLVLTGYQASGIHLIENLGDGQFAKQLLRNHSNDVRDAYDVDIDGDGDRDLAFREGGPLWLENLGGFHFELHIYADPEFSLSWPVAMQQTADLDGDGNTEFVTLTEGGGQLVRYVESAFSPIERTIAGTGPSLIQSADIDGDGDPDLLAHDTELIVWHENTGGEAVRHEIAKRSTTDVELADLNGDGQVDVLAVLALPVNGFYFWHYLNLGNGDGFSESELIRFPGSPAIDLATGDFDRDGDIDAIVLTFHNLTWFENVDGVMQVAEQRPFFHSRDDRAHASDVDGDGDIDLLVSMRVSHSVMLYENDGPAGFLAARKIVNRGRFPGPVVLGDWDNDGDSDLIEVSDDSIVWYANHDGQFQQVDAKPGPTEALLLIDIDTDGDLDLVPGPSEDRNFEAIRLSWYENRDGSFGDRRDVVVINQSFRAFVLSLDWDGDQDVDFITAEGGISWYSNGSVKADINRDGLEDSADLSLLCAALRDDNDDAMFDLNNDAKNDLDDLTVFLDSSLHTVIGDVNLDGVFDSSDLVLIFQRGEYEDDVVGNSTYFSGDWNCDGDFDSSDLVFAFQAGMYERVPGQGRIVAAVDWLFTQDQRPSRPRAYTA